MKDYETHFSIADKKLLNEIYSKAVVALDFILESANNPITVPPRVTLIHECCEIFISMRELRAA